MKPKPTYRVSVYDPEIDDVPFRSFGDNWRVRFKRVSKWGLRKVLRKLYSEGYERDTSLMVESSEYLARTDAVGTAVEPAPGQRELFQ